MRLLVLLVLFLISSYAFAIPCDCEVRVYSPITGSHRMNPTTLKLYKLESFSSYSIKNKMECRKHCLERFEEDMPAERLNALLLMYTEKLIEEKVVGFNCTGLTMLKYPVRVTAILGHAGLGNVTDVIQVIDHEQTCF